MSLMAFNKRIQCVQIGRHRERTVNIHIGVLSGSHLVNHTTTLEMRERKRNDNITVENNETVIADSKTLFEEGNGRDWKKNCSCLYA